MTGHATSGQKAPHKCLTNLVTGELACWCTQKNNQQTDTPPHEFAIVVPFPRMYLPLRPPPNLPALVLNPEVPGQQYPVLLGPLPLPNQ